MTSSKTKNFLETNSERKAGQELNRPASHRRHGFFGIPVVIVVILLVLLLLIIIFLHLRLGTGGFPLRLQDSLHLLALPLSSDVSAEALLGEFETAFVLGDFQQLEAPLLVGSEPGDLAHHLAHELDVLVLHALPAGRLRRRLVFRDAESLISDSTDGHRVFWRHF